MNMEGIVRIDPGFDGYFTEGDKKEKESLVNSRLRYYEYRCRKYISRLRLKKIGKLKVPRKDDEIRLFVYVRNESLRISHFLKYYFSKGVDRVFLVDNCSEDNTISIAQSFENVHVFQTNELYKNHWNWVEYLLDQFGSDHWCMIADADELFYYPNADSVSVRQLVQFLETEKSTAVRALLLDIYSNKNVSETKYSAGTNPLEICPYFDTKYYEWSAKFINRKKWQVFSYPIFGGGMRARCFGLNHGNILSKIPLFKYTEDTYVTQGVHAIDGANTSSVQGVVFHCKYLSDFESKVRDAVDRKQYSRESFYYARYLDKINERPDLKLAFEDSQKFSGLEQLIELGLMTSTNQYDEFALKRDKNRRVEMSEV